MVMGALAQLHAAPGDGLQPGHLRHPHAGRRRSAHRPRLRVVRDGERRVRRAPEQGRHQRHRQRHLQHDEHAGGDHGDGVSGAHRALRDQPGFGRRRPLSRRLRRAASVAHARRRGCDRCAVHGAHDLAAVRPAPAARPARRRGDADDAGRRDAPPAEQGGVRRGGGRRGRHGDAGLGRVRARSSSATGRRSAATCSTAMSPRLRPHATTVSPIRKCCATPRPRRTT